MCYTRIMRSVNMMYPDLIIMTKWGFKLYKCIWFYIYQLYKVNYFIHIRIKPVNFMQIKLILTTSCNQWLRKKTWIKNNHVIHAMKYMYNKFIIQGITRVCPTNNSQQAIKSIRGTTRVCPKNTEYWKKNVQGSEMQ